MRAIALFPALLLGLAVAGFADTSYSLPGGDKDAGNNPVSANAILSLSMLSGNTWQLIVTVDNLTSNQSSDGENITGIELNHSAAIGITGGVGSTGIVSANAPVNLIDITSKTAVTSLGAGPMSDWNATTSLSELTLTDVGGGPPAYGIIGAPNGSGVYSNANGSLTNNAAKQPYAQDTAVFTIDLTGTALTLSDFTGVEIGFGTNGTNYLNATVVTATPEPGTLWLAGLGAVLAGFASRRKRLATTFSRDLTIPAN